MRALSFLSEEFVFTVLTWPRENRGKDWDPKVSPHRRRTTDTMLFCLNYKHGILLPFRNILLESPLRSTLVFTAICFYEITMKNYLLS